MMNVKDWEKAIVSAQKMKQDMLGRLNSLSQQMDSTFDDKQKEEFNEIISKTRRFANAKDINQNEFDKFVNEMKSKLG